MALEWWEIMRDGLPDLEKPNNWITSLETNEPKVDSQNEIKYLAACNGAGSILFAISERVDDCLDTSCGQPVRWRFHEDEFDSETAGEHVLLHDWNKWGRRTIQEWRMFGEATTSFQIDDIWAFGPWWTAVTQTYTGPSRTVEHKLTTIHEPESEKSRTVSLTEGTTTVQWEEDFTDSHTMLWGSFTISNITVCWDAEFNDIECP